MADIIQAKSQHTEYFQNFVTDLNDFYDRADLINKTKNRWNQNKNRCNLKNEDTDH